MPPQSIRGATTQEKVRAYLASQQGLLRGIARVLARVPKMAPPSGVSSMGVLPAYIPARTFAVAMMNILNPVDATGKVTIDQVRKTLETQQKAEPGNDAVQAIYALALSSGDKLENFNKGLESWYNDSMDRASGWYKRYTQKILLAVGLILAVCFNVDSVRVARTLWFDRDSRQAMVSAATEYTKQHPDPPGGQATAGDKKTPSAPGDLKAKLDESAKAFKEATAEGLLPVGWKHPFPKYFVRAWYYVVLHEDAATQKAAAWDSGLFWHTTWHCLELLLGWLITGMAISLGAPFWFDALNKFMVVRSTVKPQEKSKNEGSKD